MLAEKGDQTILSNPLYLFEPKLDGIRCIAEKKGSKVFLLDRQENNFSFLFPFIKKTLKTYKENFILDGEIICYDERGLPNHKLLMRREEATTKVEIEMKANAIPATYVVFDILSLNGEDKTKLPIEERKKIIKSLIKENNYVERILFTENGQELWSLIVSKKLEGVMAKKKGSFYYPGERRPEWLKISVQKNIDVIITGYIESRNKKGFDALYIALYKDGKLVPVGKVSTGWDGETMRFLYNKLKPLAIKETEKGIEVKPELVCEVNYLELTKEKTLRAAVFKRLRRKEPQNCTWKQIE